MDRNKLLFDTVCTLSDMDFDIYHATIDCEKEKDHGDKEKEYSGYTANQEFYVRPRLGVSEWDEEKAKRLKAMLTAAIMRRFPKGLKVHVQSSQVSGSSFLALNSHQKCVFPPSLMSDCPLATVPVTVSGTVKPVQNPLLPNIQVPTPISLQISIVYEAFTPCPQGT